MAAGSIQVPTIIPLRKPGALKSTFSSATLVELATSKYYTLYG